MRPAHLPQQSTPVIGRDREHGEIAELLAEPACRLLTRDYPTLKLLSIYLSRPQPSKLHARSICAKLKLSSQAQAILQA